jgi:hypothetical protein
VEHRIDITIAERGRDPENGDRLLGALHELVPGAEGVTDQNLETGDLTVSFVIDGDSMGSAVKQAIDVFALATDRAGFGSPCAVAMSAAECVHAA